MEKFHHGEELPSLKTKEVIINFHPSNEPFTLLL